MQISIPLEILYPVELPTALKFAKFIEIFNVENWGAFWGVWSPATQYISSTCTPFKHFLKGPMDSDEIPSDLSHHGSTLAASMESDESSCPKKRKGRMSEAEKLSFSTSSSERSGKAALSIVLSPLVHEKPRSRPEPRCRPTRRHGFAPRHTTGDPRFPEGNPDALPYLAWSHDEACVSSMDAEVCWHYSFITFVYSYWSLI